MEIQYDERLSMNEAMHQVQVAETKLATRYEYLATVFKNFPHVERECRLTAFSLDPNARTFAKVCDSARQLWPDQCETADLHAIISNHGTRRQLAVESRLHDHLTDNRNGYDPTMPPKHFYDDQQLAKWLDESTANDLLNIIHVLRIKR